MTEVEKLRALLAEARPILWLHRPAGDADCDCRECSAVTGVVARIDAALAEPVQHWEQAAKIQEMFKNAAFRERDEARQLLQDVAAACRGLKPLSDEASTVVGPVFRQRDEARAEVEKLREAVNAWAKTTEWNYKRGAKAMREAAAKEVFAFYKWSKDNETTWTDIKNLAEWIDDLPVPEDKP